MHRPARRTFDVTPSDTDDLREPIVRLYVGVAGAVTGHVAQDAANVWRTFKAAAGHELDVCFTRVRATGTTAEGLVAICADFDGPQLPGLPDGFAFVVKAGSLVAHAGNFVIVPFS